MTATNGGEVTIVAHRGCAGLYPENTVLAMERSAPHVDAIEIDVRRCGSGELVVFHDERLDRVTNATGAVADTAWATLCELTILDTAQPIPRLSTALDAIPADTAVNVELKERGIAADVRSVAAEFENDVLYSSFDRAAIREVRSASADADCAYIVTGHGGPQIRTAAELDCVAIHPRYDAVLGTDVAAAAHEAGLAVNVWTIDATSPVAELVRAGVDGLIVDAWNVVDSDGDTAGNG